MRLSEMQNYMGREEESGRRAPVGGVGRTGGWGGGREEKKKEEKKGVGNRESGNGRGPRELNRDNFEQGCAKLRTLRLPGKAHGGHMGVTGIWWPIRGVANGA
jgi:hypothetical protein